MDLLKEESSTPRSMKLIEGHRLIFRRSSAYWISRLLILIEVPIVLLKCFRCSDMRNSLKLARNASGFLLFISPTTAFETLQLLICISARRIFAKSI